MDHARSNMVNCNEIRGFQIHAPKISWVLSTSWNRRAGSYVFVRLLILWHCKIMSCGKIVGPGHCVL